MRSKTCLTLALLIAVSASLVSGCAGRETIRPIFPPAADLAVEPKPRLDPAALESEAALDDFDIALEVWGERGWLAIGRICRWAKANGMDVSCPEAE